MNCRGAFTLTAILNRHNILNPVVASVKGRSHVICQNNVHTVCRLVIDNRTGRQWPNVVSGTASFRRANSTS